MDKTLTPNKFFKLKEIGIQSNHFIKEYVNLPDVGGTKYIEAFERLLTNV